MTKERKLELKNFFMENDTPMDAAERAAIKKLLELDVKGKTEYHENVPTSYRDQFLMKV